MTGAAVGLMLAAASLLHPQTAPSLVKFALVPFAAGAILLGLALRRGQLTVETARPAGADRWRPRPLPLLLGIAGLAVVAEISAEIVTSDWVERFDIHRQIALFVAAVGLVAWGLVGQRFHRRGTASSAGLLGLTGGFSRWHVGLIVVMLAGLVVRLWSLEDGMRMFLDELNFAHSARVIDERLFEVHLLQPFHFQVAFPWHYNYALYVSTEWFGRSFFGLRLPSVLIGVLTIPAVALLGRHLFGRGTALIAAALLATFPPHVHFSRLALNNIVDPLFGTLALAFLAAGLRAGRTRDFALAGVALGLTQYFYEGGRLLYPLLVIAWLAVVWVGRRGPGGGVRLRPLVVMVIAAVIIGAPVYYALVGYEWSFTTRLDMVGLSDDYWFQLRHQQIGSDMLNFFVTHVSKTALVYTHQLDLPYVFLYYGGQQAMIVAPLIPLFLLGLAVCLWRWRSAGASLLLLWLAGTSAGSILMIESAVYTRYVVAFPALALLLALGLTTTARLLIPALRWRRALLVAVLLLISVGHVTYYFGAHLPELNRQLRDHWRQAVTDDAVLRAAALPPYTHVHFINQPAEDYLSMAMAVGFFDNTLTVYTAERRFVGTEYFMAQDPFYPQAYFFDPDDAETLALLVDTYGIEAIRTTPYDLPPDDAMLLYFVPRGVIP